MILATLLFVLLSGGSAQATTINPKSGSLVDVTAAEAASVDGDIIALPAGTFTWAGMFSTGKAITLQGSGIGSTIILDAGSVNPIMRWTGVAGKPSRMTGIEFRNGGRPSGQFLINFQGSNTNGCTWRVDHCKFDHLVGFPLGPNDTIGVIDHNIFLYSAGNIPLYVFHKNWNNQGPYAAGSWHDVSHFGTSQFLFIEDNTFVADATYAAFDCDGGARIVFRHNTCTRAHCEIHGSEAVVYRGGRALEIYNNSFTGPTAGSYITNGRSGIFVIHDNTTTGIASPTLELVNYRSADVLNFGCADGTSPWDVNLPGGPFYSGTATSGTTNGGTFNQPTVTVSGASWTTDQWKGYSIKKTSISPQKASFILGNTSNTITYLNGSWPPPLSFANGDTFKLYKVVQAIDQPGRSQGSLIPLGGDPSSTPPSGWNDQVTEPCYEWNNTRTEGGTFHFDPGSFGPLIRANEHYFNSTVKPGYTPYTYPHPLTTGSTQPNPPSNLRITGS